MDDTVFMPEKLSVSRLTMTQHIAPIPDPADGGVIAKVTRYIGGLTQPQF
jgi:hypothetical protein